jgi:putative FmdB family regulatory protein
MPFYEYQCKNCGHELEAMQKVSDPPMKKCPHCGKSQLQRLMSAPVFRLKGGGWYETDFKGDQDNKRNLADRPEAEASKESAPSSAEAKTDAKAGDTKVGEVKAGEKASESISGEAAKAKDKLADKASGKSSAPPAKSPTKRRAAKRAPPAKKVPAKSKRRR